ncbi:hypothetical protein PHDIMM138B_20715 [Phytobacter diazotrophicus]
MFINGMRLLSTNGSSSLIADLLCYVLVCWVSKANVITASLLTMRGQL